MIDTIQQELREAWQKIEHLEKENKKLKEEIEGKDELVKYLEKTAEEYLESNERLVKYTKELEEDLGFHRWNKPGQLRNEMGG